MLLPLVIGFWFSVVVTESDLEVKIIPLMFVSFGWQIPVHGIVPVKGALMVQIARVFFLGVPFCHHWIRPPFLEGVGDGACQVVAWCTFSLVLAQIYVF